MVSQSSYMNARFIFHVPFVLLNQNGFYTVVESVKVRKKERKTSKREGAPNFSKIPFELFNPILYHVNDTKGDTINTSGN